MQQTGSHATAPLQLRIRKKTYLLHRLPRLGRGQPALHFVGAHVDCRLPAKHMRGKSGRVLRLQIRAARAPCLCTSGVCTVELGSKRRGPAGAHAAALGCPFRSAVDHAHPELGNDLARVLARWNGVLKNARWQRLSTQDELPRTEAQQPLAGAPPPPPLAAAQPRQPGVSGGAVGASHGPPTCTPAGGCGTRSLSEARRPHEACCPVLLPPASAGPSAWIELVGGRCVGGKPQSAHAAAVAAPPGWRPSSATPEQVPLPLPSMSSTCLQRSKAQELVTPRGQQTGSKTCAGW